MVFKPGQSGNPLGRPKGSRDVFSAAYLKDLAAVWAERGRDAMEKTALCEPAKFMAICASLIPKDVSVTLQTRLPGNLEPEDWSALQELLQAAKQALPDAGQRQPGELAELMMSALRAHTAPIITSSDHETASQIGDQTMISDS